MKRIYTLLLIVLAAATQTFAQSGLVINEVDYDQPNVDSAEFIELYNAGTTPVNLGNYSVLLFNGNSTSNVLYDSISLPTQTLNAGAYFVICGGAGKVPNCDLALAAQANIIQNGSPDAIAIRENSGASIVDVVSYEGSCIAPYVSGNGVPLAQSDTAQTDSINGRYYGISRFPDGADSNDDSTDFHRVCITPGYANVNTTSNCVTGISTPSSSSSILMYPNPSRGTVNIDLSAASAKSATVILNDILGNKLKEITLSNFNSIYQLDMTEYRNGVYFIKVLCGNNQSAQRIILNK